MPSDLRSGVGDFVDCKHIFEVGLVIWSRGFFKEGLCEKILSSYLKYLLNVQSNKLFIVSPC